MCSWGPVWVVEGVKKYLMVFAVLLEVPSSCVGCCLPYLMPAAGLVDVALEGAVVVSGASSSETVRSWTDAAAEFGCVVGAAAAAAAADLGVVVVVVGLDAVVAVGLDVVSMRWGNSGSLCRGTEDSHTLAAVFAVVAGRRVGCWDHGFELTLPKQESWTEEYDRRIDKVVAFGWPPSNRVALSIRSASLWDSLKCSGVS